MGSSPFVEFFSVLSFREYQLLSWFLTRSKGILMAPRDRCFLFSPSSKTSICRQSLTSLTPNSKHLFQVGLTVLNTVCVRNRSSLNLIEQYGSSLLERYFDAGSPSALFIFTSKRPTSPCSEEAKAVGLFRSLSRISSAFHLERLARWDGASCDDIPVIVTNSRSLPPLFSLMDFDILCVISGFMLLRSSLMLPMSS